MPSLGKYRKKIKSAKNISKITKAMQMVAASKMRRAQLAAMSGKEYSQGLTDLTSMLSQYLDKTIHPLVGIEKDPKAPTMILLISPEKGLCGGLITSLGRYVQKRFVEEKGNASFITIGSKAKIITKRLGSPIAAEFPLGLAAPDFNNVLPIARFVEDSFLNGNYKTVKVIYAEFINTMVQEITEEKLLPLELEKSAEKGNQAGKEYLFEPTPEDIVNPLLKMYLEVKIYHILLEAYASEQSARMIAMKNATDNAKSLIEGLTIEYNKVRQSMITSEILDISNQIFVS